MNTQSVSLRAYAKINLVLNIEGTSDGLHLIDTVVTPFNIFDEVNMEKRRDGEIRVRYTNGPPIENDTARKMAEIIRQEYKTGGVDIEITKKIPMKAGVGGSSADAGAVARGMQVLFSLDEIPAHLLLKVGSDVPYMYRGGDKRIRGKGEIVENVVLPNTYKVLIVAEGGVDTRKCFELYDILGGENADIGKFLIEINENRANFSNALQRAGEELNENISGAITLLKECGFQPCMTGSGSGVFGIEYDKTEFENKLKKLIKKQPKSQFFIS